MVFLWYGPYANPTYLVLDFVILFQSSFLMSILRELPVLKGVVKVNGRVAYVPQQPWVFCASLRQNIVFGNEYDQDRYTNIIKGCALDEVSVLNKNNYTLDREFSKYHKLQQKNYNHFLNNKLYCNLPEPFSNHYFLKKSLRI